MIKYKEYILDNGLSLIVHEDKNTPMAVFNLLYDVGSRDEDPENTGFAHLFEHLMFQGSKNVISFDKAVHDAGGTNNAFTSRDITNYYITLPAQNIETAFWVESDRMRFLNINEKALEVQQKVVSEEYRQSYLNNPYDDSSLLLSPLAYKVHPYRWNPIGMDISHIENSNLEHVKSFYNLHYRPNRAVLTVAGNVDAEHIYKLTQKWFGDFEPNFDYQRNLPQEPKQTQKRTQVVDRDVPQKAIYLALHMSSRTSPDYYAYDILSGILSNGESSRLYSKLYKELNLFENISTSMSRATDPGLFYINGRLSKDISLEQGLEAIGNELKNLTKNGLEKDELTKVINKVNSVLLYSNMNLLNKAMNLSYSKSIGNIDLINTEAEMYKSVSEDKIIEVAQNLFSEEKFNILLYNNEKALNS